MTLSWSRMRIVSTQDADPAPSGQPGGSHSLKEDMVHERGGSFDLSCARQQEGSQGGTGGWQGHAPECPSVIRPHYWPQGRVASSLGKP